MVELIGDPCIPSTFILPIHEGTYTGARSGEMWLSGELIWFNSNGVNATVLKTGL